MFSKLKKTISKIGLALLVVQVLSFGVAASPIGVHAAIDNVAPVLNSVVYGGAAGVPTPTNMILLDVTKSTDAQLQTMDLDVSKDSNADIKIIGGSSLYVGAVVKGTNVLNLALTGISRSVLENLASQQGGNVTVDIKLTDVAANNSNYQMILSVIDMSNPVIKSLNFAGNVATNNFNVISMPLYNVGDIELATENINVNVSKDSKIELTSPSIFSKNLLAGDNQFKIADMFGTTPTYAYLKSIASAGIVTASGTLTDKYGDKTNYTFNITLDTVGPQVKYVVKPTALNSISKGFTITFNADEPMVVDPSKMTYKTDGNAFTPIDATLVTADNSNYVIGHTVTFPGNFFTNAKNSIEVSFQAVDKAGNVTNGAVTVVVDTVAPAAVTGLIATVNADGAVVLSWVNPPADPANPIAGLNILRDGAFLTSVAPGTNTFVDTSVVRGQTYTYDVVAFDLAGNETAVAPISIKVPSNEVAAAVSDTVNYGDQNISANTTPEAAPTEAKTETKKEEKKNETNSFPAWGIVLLVILAAIGGYLIYSQKPEPVTPPATKPTKKTNTKK